ncbi:olfactory receptor 14A16-like [Tachyglossus aculeatus]|uniref:olfactory receptor 14A16-like n=1 Tax=Tachyglossus aculeatus TaxID=9261 RepID=UPI0018F420C8|nr:olfactory receptor 14A16-like [Tachyglossus aculeatus]
MAGGPLWNVVSCVYGGALRRGYFRQQRGPLEVVLIGVSVTVDFGCFFFMGVSYFHIFSTVLRIPSVQDRAKACPILLTLLVLNVCYVSVTIIQSAHNSLTNDSSISVRDCVTQVFFLVLLATTEIGILTLMSYDHYVAIYHPLCYVVVMDQRVCGKMATALCLWGGFLGLTHTASTRSLSFGDSNVIRHFLCDLTQLLALAPSNDDLREAFLPIASATLDFFCFLFIVISHFRVFPTVRTISSQEGRTKSFSTCLSHVTVITLFFSSGFFFAYLNRPQTFPRTWACCYLRSMP